MFKDTVIARFSAGHRLPNHPGLCRYPHGHSYLVEAHFEGLELGSEDWLLDFTDAKEVLRALVAQHFDHSFMVDSRDADLIAALSQVQPVRLYTFDNASPTAERIAEELYKLVAPSLMGLAAIRIWETDLQSAEYRP